MATHKVTRSHPKIGRKPKVVLMDEQIQALMAEVRALKERLHLGYHCDKHKTPICFGEHPEGGTDMYCPRCREEEGR